MPKANKYPIDLQSLAATGNAAISDIRLAARLEHIKDQTTDLLQTEIDGQHYVLRLVGNIFVEDGNGVWLSADVNQDEELLRRLEASNDLENDFVDVKLPYYEWITDEGEIASEPFDSISLNPDEEIGKLQASLQQHARDSEGSLPSPG
jgi:hypothetical protein